MTSTRYLSGANNPLWDNGLAWDLNMGLLTTPATNYVVQLCRYPFWAADNGAYTLNARWADFDHAAWWAWLNKVVAAVSPSTFAQCLYATAPDAIDVCGCKNACTCGHGNVRGNNDVTIAWAKEWLPRIKSLGVPAAMVLGNFMEERLEELPWDDIDVVFLGGSTEWKLGEGGRIVTAEAKRRGKRVHMGRVNSSKRLAYASSIGCDTADGTFLGKGPAKNLPRLMDWADIKAHVTPGNGQVCGHCSHWVADRRKGAPKGAKRRIQVRHATKAELRRWHQPAAAAA